VAAIILWNTTYLERAIGLLQQKGRTIFDDLLVHRSPLGWEHISLTGDLHLAGESAGCERSFPPTYATMGGLLFPGLKLCEANSQRT
jgi:Tn3 transposase DDE domain